MKDRTLAGRVLTTDVYQRNFANLSPVRELANNRNFDKNYLILALEELGPSLGASHYPTLTLLQEEFLSYLK